MILYLYHNNLCDPLKNIGVCRQFHRAKDLDDYVKFFVVSLLPKFFTNWRIFVTNDTVEFVEVDHHVLIDEPYKLGLNRERIKELDIHEIAREVNKTYKRLMKRRDEARLEAEKKIKKMQTDESARKKLPKE